MCKAIALKLSFRCESVESKGNRNRRVEKGAGIKPYRQRKIETGVSEGHIFKFAVLIGFFALTFASKTSILKL